jgi:hypothetical protein
MPTIQFIYPGFLLASLVMAIPIIIHLLFRQRARKVPIGSIRFLVPVVKEHRRRRKVKQWLLLALRMLGMLFLTFLFCRPYLNRSELLGLQQEVILLIDKSASMQAVDSRGDSSMAQAIERSKKELARLDDNAIVHLATFDSTGIEELPVEKLPLITPTQAATDYGLAFSWATDIFAASKRASKKIILLTDLQQSGLQRAAMKPLPRGVELVLHELGDPLARNITIESADATQTEIRPQGQIKIRVNLRNHSPLVVRDLIVRCDVDHATTKDHYTQELATEIPVLGRTTLEFSLPIQTDGLYKGKVSIDTDDALRIDDTRWIAFEARRPDRVLLVDGQEGRSVYANETYYLETALRLQMTEFDGPVRSFEPERIAWESGKGFPRLDGYRAVVLANVRQLTEQDAQRMESYLRDGGSLLVFAGDQVRPESLKEFERAGLLPGILRRSAISGRFRIARWDNEHPALECFNDPQQGDLRRIDIRKLLPLESLAPNATSLLSTTDHVLAAELQIGKGRSVYFGFSADRDWTTLPQSPMYVPLMRQMLAHLTHQLSERSAVTSETISKKGQSAGIVPKADKPGEWLVANIDPRESELRRIQADEMVKITGAESIESADRATALEAIEIPADATRPDELWTIVAWLLFAILAAELLLSGRIHA